MNPYPFTEEEMREQAEFENFLENFVGPPTLKEVAEAQQAELEYIDQQMLANAY
jgi:hypothetical protein